MRNVPSVGLIPAPKKINCTRLQLGDVNRGKNWKGGGEEKKGRKKERKKEKKDSKKEERGGSQRSSLWIASQERFWLLSGVGETVAGLPLRPTHVPSFRPIGPRWSRIPANNGQLIRYRDRLHTNIHGIKYICCVDGGWRAFAGKSASRCSFVPLFFAHRGRREGERREGKQRNAYVGRLSFADRRPRERRAE